MGNAKSRPTHPDKLFLPYQTAWINDRSRLKLMEKSRQIGISWAAAYDNDQIVAVKTAMYDEWVSSRDDIQARLFLEDCKKFAELLNVAARDLGEQIIDEEKKLSAFVLQFSNGRRIHSMSSNPDAQAGKRGGRTLDEFALHKDPRKLYTIAYPGITWGGALKMVSTHRGSANFFNELVQEVKHDGNPKKISLHTVTLQDALDQGFLFKLQAKLPPADERQDMDEAAYFDFIRSGCADEEQFLQEYMCVPADDASAFLTYDQIAACEYARGEDWDVCLDDPAHSVFPFRRELYLGVDVGREHDLTVMWVIERYMGQLFTRKILEFQKATFTDQESALYELLETPGLRRCCIDSTGLGMQFAERAADRFGSYKVEGVRFTGPVKEALAYPLRAAFEDQAIKIPKSDQIRSDLRSIKKTTTAAGNVRFEADRGKNGHADRFWALALAIHAAQNPSGPIEYETVEPGRMSETSGAWG
jgi:phage FluMu gp28-like protein